MTAMNHSLKVYSKYADIIYGSEVFIFCLKCGERMDPENQIFSTCRSAVSSEHSFDVFLVGQDGFLGKPIVGCACNATKGEKIHLANGDLFTSVEVFETSH